MTRALAAVTVVTAGLYVSANMPTMVYGALGDDPMTPALLFAAYAMGLVPTVLLTPVIMPRASARAVSLTASVVGVIAVVPFVGSPVAEDLFAGRVLQGVSVGMVTALALSLTVGVLPPRVAALWFTLVTSLAAGLGPPLAGALISATGALAPPFFAVATLLSGCTALSFTLPTTSVTPLARDRSVVPVRRHPELRGGIALQCVLVALAMAGVGVFQALGPQILGRAVQMESAFAQGCVVALVLLVSCVIQVSVASLPSFPLRVMGLLALVVGAAAFCAMVMTGGMPLAVLAATCVGTAHAGLYLTATREAAILIGDGRSRSRMLSSVYVSCVYAGLVAPSLLIGAGAARVGLAPAANAAFAIVAVAALVLLAGVRRTPTVAG